MARPIGYVVLEGALRLLENPEHWVQGYLRMRRKGTFAYCIDGAIRASARNFGVFRYDRRRIAACGRQILLDQMGGQNKRDIHGWNDDEKRTHAEVIALFRGALGYRTPAREPAPQPMLLAA
jgi:hypothetical protein